LTGQLTFSIIVPVLNEEKLLPGLLDNLSIITKTQNSVELIIADGGSSDKSVELCKSRVDKIIDVSREVVIISHPEGIQGRGRLPVIY
jgi:glycosyltransferase involved in cell wall biosynthesis